MKLLLFICLFTLVSCATDRPVGKTEAEILYKEAEELKSEERFTLANEKLGELRSQFPYSYYSTSAELMQADILFMQENYTEAASAYLLFKDFHPKNKKISYVIWRIAEAFYNQLPDSIDRDLSVGMQAIKYYSELSYAFPNSNYGKDASKKIKKCKEMLKLKEKYIADFYFKTKVYDSARYRYLDIIKTFKDKKLLDHSMLRVIESSNKLHDKSGCDTYFKKFAIRTSIEVKKKMQKIVKNCGAKKT